MSQISVIRAETMGFCMGVKRAVHIVEELVEKNRGKPIYTIGPLIHNSLVIKGLEKRGVYSVGEPSEIVEGTAVIRAHGITPEIREALERREIAIVDATCPRVLQSQDTIEEYSGKGYFIVIVGDKQHGEVKGLAGFAKEYVVIQSEEEARSVELREPVLVIAQTTMKAPTYRKIADIIKSRSKEAVICSSLCGSVEMRQAAVRELAEEVEAILVIGGKNSANTRNLYETAKTLKGNAWHIESPEEIPPEITHFKTVGISAGASTPEWIIKRIEDRLKNVETETA